MRAPRDADRDLVIVHLQADRIFAGDHLIHHLARRKAEAGDPLRRELAQIGHALILAHRLQHQAHEAGAAGTRRSVIP
ncbi:MAG TPA: hypothetical protein VG271_18995, partial [Beijerinckiaceae bacterium]|nr:hypothetical protein [Beijerinckiaceae bacterium]